jgi:ATP-dependent RNA helicase DHX36
MGGNWWKGSHAYNKGRNTVLVVSKLPLPNYRADLDDHHGSSQRQITMSAATETRVENMLANIRDTNGSSASTSRSLGGEGSGQGSQLSTAARENPQPRMPASGVDKEKQNVQLRENQHQLKVFRLFLQ